jgi:hypothetical protein
VNLRAFLLPVITFLSHPEHFQEKHGEKIMDLLGKCSPTMNKIITEKIPHLIMTAEGASYGSVKRGYS